jgi:hypothetical protein
MDDVKNKMYNYETTPPEGVWQAIAAELDSDEGKKDEAKVIPITKKRNYSFYYIAAASVAVLLFYVILFNNRSSQPAKDQFVVTPNNTQNDTATTNNDKAIITVPEEEIVAKNDNTTTANTDKEITQIKSHKGGPNPDEDNEATKKTEDSVDKNIIASNANPQYITIEGPQGKPVKVSSKMASLIDSSNEKVPPKPIWNKKINEWREIMKGNTLAPTPGNFLDIIELTKTLKDHK